MLTYAVIWICVLGSYLFLSWDSSRSYSCRTPSTIIIWGMNTNSIVRTHAEFFINKSFKKIPTVGTQHQFDIHRLQEKAVYDHTWVTSCTYHKIKGIITISWGPKPLDFEWIYFQVDMVSVSTKVHRSESNPLQIKFNAPAKEVELDWRNWLTSNWHRTGLRWMDLRQKNWIETFNVFWTQ